MQMRHVVITQSVAREVRAMDMSAVVSKDIRDTKHITKGRRVQQIHLIVLVCLVVWLTRMSVVFVTMMLRTTVSWTAMVRVVVFHRSMATCRSMA